MADLRIVDAPDLPLEELTEEVKIPTGGKGNYAVKAGDVATFVEATKDLANKTFVNNSSNGVKDLLDAHKNNQENPHGVTKEQVGLGNVDNTADLDKPVSNATSANIITATQGKADKTYVDTQLGLKADKTYVDTQDTLKADKTYVDTQLSFKANKTYVDTQLGLKANKADLGTASSYDFEDLPVSNAQKEVNDKTVGTVESIADLISIPNPKNGQVVYVKSIEKNYTYTLNSTEIENGVTVVDKWIMEIPDAYYASWFAEKETQLDQSKMLQLGYDYAVSKIRPYIIDAHFYVDPTNATKSSIFIRSNSSLVFSKGVGKIQQMATNSTNYDILRIQDIDNYLIFDADLIGDKDVHIGTDGEWGYGLTVYQSSNGYIRNPKVSKTWGDGIYVGKQWGLINDTVPTNVVIEYPIIDGAGRNGISFTSGDNVRITNPHIKNTSGKAPQSGIDVEPEYSPEAVPARLNNCVITNPIIENCPLGIVTYFFPSNATYELHIQGVTKISNCGQPLVACAGGSENKGYVLYDRIDIEGSYGNTLIQNAWHKSGNFNFTVNELNTDSNLPIVMTLNGEFPTKILGNFEIKNITSTATSGRMGYYIPPEITGFTDNSSYIFSKSEKENAYIDNVSSNVLGKDFNLESSGFHNGFSSSTVIYPNIIWQTPPDPTTAVYLNTEDDLRVLKIGLKYDGIVGNGCNINGLNLMIDGVAKTQARTTTLGGWIKFQNTAGGITRIFDSYGVWTFS